MDIAYEFKLPDGTERIFRIKLDPDSGLVELDNQEDQNVPSWTELTFHQCPHCPLSATDSAQCPAAAAVEPLVEGFGQIKSYDEVQVTVRMPQRTVTSESKADTAARSLMGLVMAGSGCPQLSFFRPMARFHLPFADAEETAFRTIASYILAMHLGQNHDATGEEKVTIEALTTIYEKIGTLNRAFIERLLAASDTDTNLNALAELDVLAMSVPGSLEEMVGSLGPLFSDFLANMRSDVSQPQ